MTRPYRGKRIDTGEWEFGGLYVNTNDEKHWIITHGDLDEYYYASVVSPETVGQYIGIDDMSDERLYQGDLLQDDYGIGEVEWIQEHCAFMVFTSNPSQYHRIESDGKLTKTRKVGNRWDHPHLLKGTERVGNTE